MSATGNYLERAVSAMASYLATAIPTELATIESDGSLAAGSIPRPVAYLAHRADFDNRSPLVCVFDDGATFLDSRPFMMHTRIAVLFSYEGDARIAAGELTMRRYITALIDAVRRDPTLGGAVTNAELIEIDSARIAGDTSTTRYVWAGVYNVHTYRRIET